MIIKLIQIMVIIGISKYDVFFAQFTEIPNKSRILNEKLEINTYGHKMFRVRV